VFVVTDFQGDILAHLTLPVRVDHLPLPVVADLVEDGGLDGRTHGRNSYRGLSRS
jgi:hypothetical protein